MHRLRKQPFAVACRLKRKMHYRRIVHGNKIKRSQVELEKEIQREEVCARFVGPKIYSPIVGEEIRFAAIEFQPFAFEIHSQQLAAFRDISFDSFPFRECAQA